MKTFVVICFILQAVFLLSYAHQFFYLVYSLFKRPEKTPPAAPRRYGVLIAARNEEKVIGDLLDSLTRQDYPAELLHVFVVADNCTDQTAAVARRAGATVFERFNTARVGKGWALDFLVSRIDIADYDGFFVFDADNLLEHDYIARMNEVFAQGHRIITGYRNSKNFSDNWISSGSSLWFLHDSRQLNGARMSLGTSCVVGGTGFLVSSEVLRENGGWPYHLLTEDTEFTIDMVLRGERIAYCGDAVLYDEQPVSFSQSWKQRMRWCRGYLQILDRYGKRIFSGLFGKNGFACYDVAMAFMPAIIISILGFLVGAAQAVCGVLILHAGVLALTSALILGVCGMYFTLFFIGAMTLLSERRRIRASLGGRLRCLFTFPIFMLTYFPVAVAAMFRDTGWAPIEHTVRKSLAEVTAVH